MHVFLIFSFGLTPTQISNSGVKISDKIGAAHHIRDLIYISNINIYFEIGVEDGPH